MESTPYVFPFRMVFFYLVSTGWIFDVSLCENPVYYGIDSVKYGDWSGIPVFAFLGKVDNLEILCRTF